MPIDQKAMAQRLEHFITANGFAEQKKFAHHIGIEPSRLHNFLGDQQLTWDVIDAMRDKFPGVTSDWFRYGVRDGLSSQMRDRLDQPQKPLLRRIRKPR